MFKRLLSAAVCLIFALSLAGCGGRPKIESTEGWYTVWNAVPESAGPGQLPRINSISGSTCRQQIKVSLGGDKLRLTFSNEFGRSALKIDSVHIAKLISAGSPTVDLSTDTEVTFSGLSSVSVPAGKTVTSDEIAFSFEALDLLSVSTKFSSVPAAVTCHPEANCTTWFAEGDCVSDESLSRVELMSGWYFLSSLETWAEAGTETLAAIGDGITAGIGATYNGFSSWPDKLAEQMQSDPLTENISVVNASFSGATLSEDTVERCLSGISGVHGVIILLGAEDIVSAQFDTSQLITDQLKEITKQLHSQGLSVFCGTVTPFEGDNIYYSELHEKIRQSVNAFITGPESGLDGFIDFANFLCRAENPSKMQTVYDSGDGLHPSASGHDAMAKAAYGTVREAELASRGDEQ